MIDAGEKYGSVFTNCMGGYGGERQNVLYVHGKKQDGSDDWSNSYTINFEDRNDESIIEEIGDGCFVTAGLQKDVKGKTVYKKFLSPYDFIEYISENLTGDMAVNVKGNLRYQFYNGRTTVQMEVTSIALSNAEPQDYHAYFTQTVLLDENSKGEIDKEAGELDVLGYALEYAKEYRGHDVTDKKTKRGTQVPMPFNFKYKINLANPDLTKKAVKKLFGIKSGTVSQITFDGEIVSSGATVQVTEDMIPDDIRNLIDMGVYTLEDALTACATNGNREQKMILLRPRIRNVSQSDGTVTHEVQIYEEQYDYEDLAYYLEMSEPEEPEEMKEDAMNPPVDEEDEVEFDSDDDSSDLSWLENL